MVDDYVALGSLYTFSTTLEKFVVSDTMHPDGTETVSETDSYERNLRMSYDRCNGLSLTRNVEYGFIQAMVRW
jgi:hypothetical protein